MSYREIIAVCGQNVELLCGEPHDSWANLRIEFPLRTIFKDQVLTSGRLTETCCKNLQKLDYSEDLDCT